MPDDRDPSQKSEFLNGNFPLAAGGKYVRNV